MAESCGGIQREGEGQSHWPACSLSISLVCSPAASALLASVSAKHSVYNRWLSLLMWACARPQPTPSRGAGFNRWLAEGIYLGALLAYLPAASFGWSPDISLWTSMGDPSWAALSFTAFNALILIVNLR